MKRGKKLVRAEKSVPHVYTYDAGEKFVFVTTDSKGVVRVSVEGEPDGKR